jgi:hypothetical protein
LRRPLRRPSPRRSGCYQTWARRIAARWRSCATG